MTKEQIMKVYNSEASPLEKRNFLLSEFEKTSNPDHQLMLEMLIEGLALEIYDTSI